VTLKELKDCIYKDFRRYRVTGGTSIIKILLNQGFLFTTVFRINTWIYQLCKPLPIINKLVGLYVFVWLKISQIVSGLSIQVNTKIGKGLFISHAGPIIINPGVHIGENCNLAPMTVIGYGHYKGEYGTPTIGNRVFIGPGAKILGPITIGDNVAIGANAVITKPVPDNAVVIEFNKIVSFKGSRHYVKVDL